MRLLCEFTWDSLPQSLTPEPKRGLLAYGYQPFIVLGEEHYKGGLWTLNGIIWLEYRDLVSANTCTLPARAEEKKANDNKFLINLCKLGKGFLNSKYSIKLGCEWDEKVLIQTKRKEFVYFITCMRIRSFKLLLKETPPCYFRYIKEIKFWIQRIYFLNFQ